jgi:hypothetical protein
LVVVVMEPAGPRRFDYGVTVLARVTICQWREMEGATR